MRNDQWKIGDWVKGRTVNGELVHGYIVAIDSLKGILKIHVVACDRESTIGRTIETHSRFVREFPAYEDISEAQIQDLIDIALMTKDKEWFLELSRKLTTMRQKDNGWVRSSSCSWHFRPASR